MNETGQVQDRQRARGHWRFYGRQEELAWLHDRLDLDHPPYPQSFPALGIGGRRGVGKTELLREVVRREAASVTNAPARRFLVVNLPVLEKDEDHVEAIIEAMANHDMEDLLGTLSPRRSHQNSGLWCGIIIHHLMKHGVIVGLDEFHHARKSGLPSALQFMLDEQKSPGTDADKLLTGRLVLMGSHQQQFRAMFAQDQPLHLRVRIEHNLQPWPPSTI